MNARRPDTLLRSLKALADPGRIRILALLKTGEKCVCELIDATGAPQPLLSHHLRVLKEAGLVTVRRSGRWAYYSAAPVALRSVARTVAELAPLATAARRKAADCA